MSLSTQTLTPDAATAASTPAADTVQQMDPSQSRGPMPIGRVARPSTYPRVLDWAFNIFSSTRLLTYLPTLWAIWASGDSSQHSLLTWGAWVGSNATMAAWLYEKNGRRIDKAVVVTAGNSLMCATACVLIVIYRIG